MDLEEKQEKMEYRTQADLFVHPEPCSPREWNRILREIAGLDEHGDQILRIVWGGSAKRPGYIQKSHGSVPAMVTRYPAKGIQKLLVEKGFHYKDSTDHWVFVTRPDHIPKTATIITPVIEEVSLGNLRWIFEKKFPPAALILLGHFPDPDSPEGKMWCVDKSGRRYRAPMDKKGEYIPVCPLETPDGKYWEPTREWFEGIRGAHHFEMNATEEEKDAFLEKMLFEEDERTRKTAEYREEQSDIIFEESLIEVEKAPRERVIFH